MNDIKSLYEKISGDWPVGEPLDFVDNKISTLYDDIFLDLDAQNYSDWQKRVAENFPMLDFSNKNTDKK